MRPLEQPIDQLPDAIWRNYACSRGGAVALISISDHEGLPGKVVVTVSTDLRRIWRIPRWYADFRLSFAIAWMLRQNGGVSLRD